MNLHIRLSDYLSLRRSLGYKLVSEGKLLNTFVCYLDRNSLDYVTIETSLSWAKKSVSTRPCRWGRRLSIIRGFAGYLLTLDQRTEVPPVDLLPTQHRRPTPFLLTMKDIEKLLYGTINRPNTPEMLRRSLYCIYGLLVVTGLRISEALKLRDQDIDFEGGVITVECSKFGKSRLVPLHPTTIGALQSYQEIRKKALNNSMNHFFANQHGKPIGYDSVRYHFKKIFKSIGLADQPGKIQPTLHDLRHFFAISTIRRWYESGEDVQAKLPIFSTFLGHVETRNTYWYISACPDLMMAAAHRLENRRGEKQ